MWIKQFASYIEKEIAKPHLLNNTEVVIDARNFFYKSYKESGLQFRFGCESDKYSQFIRNKLDIFKKANVKCYFLLRGGHRDQEQSVINIKRPVNSFTKPLIIPIFVRSICVQVLDEMGFDYAFCEFTTQSECIAFAKKHNCPLISHGIQFCFSGVQYIPFTTFDFDEELNELRCKLMTLDDIIKKYHVTEDKLAIFITLTDQSIFPENHFIDFLRSLRKPTNFYDRIGTILRWLSGVSTEQAKNCIFKYISTVDSTKFLEAMKEMRANYIRRNIEPGLPTRYLEDRNNAKIMANDPLWFEKGVVTGQIPVRYINLYRRNRMYGSWILGSSKSKDDALLFSAEIIQYAFNLLRNFEDCKFTVFAETESIREHKNNTVAVISGTFKKPSYEAIESPFENGWGEIRSLQLFEHFLIESLQEFDFSTLKTLPEDAQLLMIALVYFSRKKSDDTSAEVCSVLLSYVVLNILSDVNVDDSMATNTERPILDPTTDKNSISTADKVVAKKLWARHIHLTREFKMTPSERYQLMNTVHNHVEFQHCLDEMNNLNQLCGRPFLPTIYSKTFNGTLVFEVLYAMFDSEHDALTYIEKEVLGPSPTVLAFYNGLFRVYSQIMYS